MSFEPSQGIFIVCNMDKAPIILVQIKVVLNRNMFSLLNIIKGPPDLQLEEYGIKKKKRIIFHINYEKGKETGRRKETWQRTLRLTYKQLSSPFKIIRNTLSIIIL